MDAMRTRGLSGSEGQKRLTRRAVSVQRHEALPEARISVFGEHAAAWLVGVESLRHAASWPQASGFNKIDIC